MTGLRVMQRFLLMVGAVLASLIVMAGCNNRPSGKVQGYAEGEFVYVASPLSGELKSLRAQRGMQVKAGDLLFSLDTSPEKETRDEAGRRLAQARASLEDLRKGKRPP